MKTTEENKHELTEEELEGVNGGRMPKRPSTSEPIEIVKVPISSDKMNPSMVPMFK